MIADKLLSIVIPSKNNHFLISQQLKCFLRWPSLKKIEIIINDNSDAEFDDNSLLSQFEISDLKYMHYPDAMPMNENWDKGFFSSTGKYVTILGDDDLITPKVLEDLEYLEKEKLDGCYYPNISSFLWPDVTSFWFKENSEGIFLESMNRKKSNTNLSNNLNKILELGGTEYLEYLPSVYHGVIKKSLLQTVYDDIGTLFPGRCPDISNAILNAVYGKSFVTSENNSIISGARLGSGAAEGYMKRHHGSFEDRKNVFGDKEVNNKIPKFFCNKTIWSLSVYETLKKIRKDNMKINYEYLHAACLVYHPKYFYDAVASIRKNRLNLFLIFIYCFASIFKRLNAFFQNIFLRIFGFNQYYKVSRGYNDLDELAKRIF